MAVLVDSNETTSAQLQALQDARVNAALSFRFVGSPDPRRSRPLSTQRKRRAPQRSTCWRHPSSTAIARSSFNASRHCAYRLFINSRKTPRKAVLLLTAPVFPIYKELVARLIAKSCVASSPPICRSNSRPSSSS